MTETGKDITRAVDLISHGKLVAIPTETVYGLAGNGVDVKVVADIFKVKNRPSFDPMILHFSSLDAIQAYVLEIPEEARALANLFWPGPITFLLHKSNRVPDLVTAGSAKVAVRVPSHPMTRKVLTGIDFPLAAPSANPFGYISPTTAEHVADQLGGKIPYILDGGSCEVGIESTIVDLTSDVPRILRKGGITAEQIEAVVGEVEIVTHSSSNPAAPGMLKSHYSPAIPLTLEKLEQVLETHEPTDIGALFFNKKDDRLPEANQFVMSQEGDLREAAANLFGHLRILDKQGFKVIVSELVPDTGLGKAINDKLMRAAAR